MNSLLSHFGKYRRPARAALMLLALSCAAAHAAAPSWVSFIPGAAASAAPGHSATVALEFQVQPGFHINSSRPHSQLFIPTRLELASPAGLRVSGIVYPAGHELRLSFAPREPLSVYSGRFSIRARVAALAAAAPGRYQVQGELHYQACDDRACYPPKTVPVSFAVEVARAR